LYKFCRSRVSGAICPSGLIPRDIHRSPDCQQKIVN
jgi:hypothetical protein